MRYTTLEIPYNFDLNLIKQIYTMVAIGEMSLDAIYCFYVPPLWQDCPSVIRSDDLPNVGNNMDRETYSKHLEIINGLFPGKCQLIIQNNYFMPMEKLKFYTDFGINNFCVGNFEQAKYIRENIPNAEIVASITMGLYKEDIESHNEYKGVFNGIVLPMAYSQKLNEVKTLPKDYFYIMLANQSCSVYCDGVHH